MVEDEDIRKIVEWMADLDELHLAFREPNLGKDENWLPESSEGKAILARLTDPENRAALRKWFARSGIDGLNPSARQFKASLERTIRESLDLETVTR